MNNVKIKITTTQTDYKGKTIFDTIANELMIEETFSLLDEEGTIQTTLYGDAVITDDTYTLSYAEGDDFGIEEQVTTVLKFKLNTPKEVTLVRSGGVESVMFFEEGKRDISVYQTGIFPFEICVYTASIDNRLITDGYFEMSYLVEIKGAQAQHTILKIETTSI